MKEITIGETTIPHYYDESYIPSEYNSDLISTGYGLNHWIYVNSYKAKAPTDGLYFMYGVSNNQTLYFFAYLEKGEIFNEFGKQYDYIVSRFHIVEPYQKESNDWIEFSINLPINTFGYLLIAYRKKGEHDIRYAIEEVSNKYKYENKTWKYYFEHERHNTGPYLGTVDGWSGTGTTIFPNHEAEYYEDCYEYTINDSNNILRMYEAHNLHEQEEVELIAFHGCIYK